MNKNDRANIRAVLDAAQILLDAPISVSSFISSEDILDSLIADIHLACNGFRPHHLATMLEQDNTNRQSSREG